MSERWKSMLNNILGVAALVMGIILIIRVHTLSAAVLSLILGTILGELHCGAAAGTHGDSRIKGVKYAIEADSFRRPPLQPRPFK